MNYYASSTGQTVVNKHGNVMTRSNIILPVDIKNMLLEICYCERYQMSEMIGRMILQYAQSNGYDHEGKKIEAS